MVKRYDEEDERGCYVLYSDYAALELKMNTARTALEKIADSRKYGDCSRLLKEIIVIASEAVAETR